MSQYQCRFLNHANAMFSRAYFTADDDDAAIRRALTVYRNGVGKGFEIWKADRLLYTYNYNVPMDATAVRP
jgi:hypothetical protein